MRFSAGKSFLPGAPFYGEIPRGERRESCDLVPLQTLFQNSQVPVVREKGRPILRMSAAELIDVRGYLRRITRKSQSRLLCA